jgi:hypothetical protein
MIGITRSRPVPIGIVDLNLLPLALRPARVPAIVVPLAAALFLAVIAIAPLAFIEHHARQHADTIEQQANGAQQSLESIQLVVSRHRALQAQIDATQAKTSALRTVRERLQGGKRPLADDLAHLLDATVVQPGARIVTVTGTDTGMRVEGTAAGPLDAIAYADNLMRKGGFPSARMASYAPGKAGGQFTIEVTR